MRLPFSGEGKAVPNRRDLIAKAQQASSKNKKKAIALYREALVLDDNDPDSHLRLAELLAKTGERGPAYASFRSAADGFIAKGFLDKAIAAYRTATEATPDFEEAWERLAELNLERERPAEAITALEAGRKRYKRAYDRPRAIRLLYRLRQLQPERLSVTADLCRTLKKEKRHDEAKALLAALVETRPPGSGRRRVRWLQLSLYFRPRLLWWWLRGK
jgi:tetratricopeptide (TPR) repeat protein